MYISQYCYVPGCVSNDNRRLRGVQFILLPTRFSGVLPILYIFWFFYFFLFFKSFVKP